MIRAVIQNACSQFGARAAARLRRASAFAAGLAVLSPIATGAPGPDQAAGSPDTDLAILQAEVNLLHGVVARQEADLRQLQARNADLQLNLSAFQGAVALASNGAPARRDPAESPSSTLDWTSALRVAAAANLMVPGSMLLTVMPTGSMEPMFNERAILLMEPARFEDLKIGDIVTYKNPRYGLVVVHRIMEKRGDKFWSKGDHNGRMDPIYITRDNYGARVFGIIYAREPSAQSIRYSQNSAAQ